VAKRPAHSAPTRRAVRSLWVLVAFAVLASGSLSAALFAEAGAFTGTRVAVSGLVLLTCVILATRVLIALERRRGRAMNQSKKRLTNPEPGEAGL
jgi:hypothetical protein